MVRIGLKQTDYTFIKGFVLLVILLAGVVFTDLSAQSDANIVAWNMANQGRIEDAIAHISKSLDQNGDNPQDLNTRAYFYFMAGKYGSSLKDCKKYVSKYPGNTDIYILMGDIYLISNDYLKSIEAYTSAKDFSEKTVSKQYCQLKRSSAYNKIKLYKEAMEDLQAAQSIFSYDSLYLFNLAYAQFYLNQTEEAMANLSKLNENYPNYPETYALYATIYNHAGNYTDAFSMLKKYTVLTKASPDKYDMLYQLSMQQNDTLSAIEAMEAKRSYYETPFDEGILLAELYCATENFAKAIEVVEKLSNNSPENPLIYKFKGDIYLKRNNIDVACDCYFMALKNGYMEQHDDNLLQEYIKTCE